MDIAGFYLKVRYNLKLLIPEKRVVIKGEQEPSYAPPIFVIGCYRSGTSLIRRMLDSHSRVACPPESKFMVELLEMLMDKKAMDGLDSMGFSREQVYNKTRGYINYYFMNYARSKGKDIWADKTPDHVEYIDVIDDLFLNEAKFVFIYRNGLDVASSLCTRHFQAPERYISTNRIADRYVGCARFWADQVEKMKKSGVLKSGRAHEIRYEELVQDPDNTLSCLFEYLGLEYEPEIVDYHMFEHDKGHEDGIVTIMKGISPSINNYRSMPGDKLDEAMRHIGTTLKSLGYER